MQVLFPLMRTGLLAAALLVFAKCLGDFSVTYVLGLPVQFDVLSTSLYRSIGSRQSGVAGVLAGSIMIMGLIALLIDAYVVREARRFVTVGSKGVMDRITPLKKWRVPVTGFAALIFVISVGLPVLTLTLSTIMIVPANFNLDNFTLQYWIGSDLETIALQIGILLAPDMWAEAWNTVRIVGTAAV